MPHALAFTLMILLLFGAATSRTIYALKLRGLRNPTLEVCHQPSLDLSCEFRESSTVTSQVFALFNRRDSLNRTTAFAWRLKMK